MPCTAFFFQCIIYCVRFRIAMAHSARSKIIFDIAGSISNHGVGTLSLRPDAGLPHKRGELQLRASRCEHTPKSEFALSFIEVKRRGRDVRPNSFDRRDLDITVFNSKIILLFRQYDKVICRQLLGCYLNRHFSVYTPMWIQATSVLMLTHISLLPSCV